MHQSAFFVNADMPLVSEMPLIAFFRRMRFRISLLWTILCGGRSCNQSRIHDRSFFQNEPSFFKNLHNRCKDFFLNAVLFQKISESADGIPIRHFIRWCYSAKLRERTAVNDFRHNAHICKIIEILQQKDSQHQFQRIRFIPALSFVIARLNDSYECIPRYDAFDFVQKFFFAGSGLPQLVVHHGQCQLCFHTPIIPRFSPLCNCAVLPYLS